MNKLDLKAHIAKTKQVNSVNELAKEAISRANNTHHLVIIHVLHNVMEKSSAFGELFIRAAQIYAESNPIVDLRMTQGKESLIAISNVKPSGLGAEADLELPTIASHHQEALNSSQELTELFLQLVDFSQKDSESFEMAAEALRLALQFQHPTHTQDFLDSFLFAVRTVKSNGIFTDISKATRKAF